VSKAPFKIIALITSFKHGYKKEKLRILRSFEGVLYIFYNNFCSKHTNAGKCRNLNRAVGKKRGNHGNGKAYGGGYCAVGGKNSKSECHRKIPDAYGQAIFYTFFEFIDINYYFTNLSNASI